MMRVGVSEKASQATEPEENKKRKIRIA